jgi:hypothetical protein
MNLSKAPQGLGRQGLSGTSGMLLTLEPEQSQLEILRVREGWPPALWEAFRKAIPERSWLPELVPQLLAALRMTVRRPPLLAEWAAACRGADLGMLCTLRAVVGPQLVPVPIHDGEGGAALTSWAPFSGPNRGAMEAPLGGSSSPPIDGANQKEYLLECALGYFHGVDIRDMSSARLAWEVTDELLSDYQPEESDPTRPYPVVQGSR